MAEHRHTKPFQGGRLRALRIARDMTLDDVARLVRTDRFHLSRFENGHKQPSADFLSRLADVFETTTDYLLGRTDNAGIPTLSAREKQVLDALRRNAYPELLRLLGADPQQERE